jgi:hypothetical protein
MDVLGDIYIKFIGKNVRVHAFSLLTHPGAGQARHVLPHVLPHLLYSAAHLVLGDGRLRQSPVQQLRHGHVYGHSLRQATSASPHPTHPRTRPFHDQIRENAKGEKLCPHTSLSSLLML